MPDVKDVSTEEIVAELDKAGYELDLNEMSKNDLLEIYLSVAQLKEEGVIAAKKDSKKTLIKKCIELGDSIDLDVLPMNILKKMLVKATGKDTISDSDKQPGERIEEAKRKRNKHEEPTSIQEMDVVKNSEGVVLRKGAKIGLRKIENVDDDKLRELQQNKGILAGYDPVLKCAYVKEG